MDSFKNQPAPQQEAKLHFLDYWRIIRIRKAIIITVFLITAIIATAVTFILPESYASTCRIKVEGEGADIPSMSSGPSSVMSPYDPFFIQTTFEIIQSQVVLSNVINQLNLNVEWGKKYNNGETLKSTETMEVLKRRMVLQPVRNTKLISITVYSEDKYEAAKLANTIATAYQDYRLSSRKELTVGGLNVLEEQFKDSEASIEKSQTNVDYLRGKLGIVDNDPNEMMPTPTLSQQMVQTYDQQMIDGERTYKMLQTQLDELKGYDNEKLRDVLPTITSDEQLSDLLGKLNVAQQTYATYTNDYSAADLHITRVQSTITELKHEIDLRVIGIMRALESEVKSKQAAVEALKASVEEAKLSDQQEQERGQPYWDEKRHLENLEEFNKQLAAKIEATKIDLSIPASSLVTITDFGQPGDVPVKPEHRLGSDFRFDHGCGPGVFH